MNHQANDRPVVGLKLPQGYTVQSLLTANGERFKAVGGFWHGPVRNKPCAAEEDAWTHYYVTHGAKPRLRVFRGTVVDVLTGFSVSPQDIAQAGSYAAAFRLKAERMRATADTSMLLMLREAVARLADKYEEVAQRLEVRRVHDK